MADGFASEIKSIDKTHVSKVAEGFSIVECNVNSAFVGSTLAELRLRNKYGLEVLMIKQKKSLFDENATMPKLIIPDPNYIIKADDILVLFGSDENVAKTSEWK